jgi:adenylate cyclase
MIHQEIEFKYVIKYLPEPLPSGIELTQAYLPTKEHTTKRIRKNVSATQTKYYLTLKSKGLIARTEDEQEISAEEFQEYWQQKRPGEVHKKRFTIPLLIGTYQLQAEFDEYYDQLQGLLTVEVEVPDVQLHPLILPALQKQFGYTDAEIKDVTEDTRFKNSNLLLGEPPLPW